MQTNEMKKRKLKRLNKALCITSVVAIILAVIVVPSFALGTGGSESNIVGASFPVNSRIYLYQYYESTQYGYTSDVTYCNDFALPLVANEAVPSQTGRTFLTPSLYGNNANGFNVEYEVFAGSTEADNYASYYVSYGSLNEIWGKWQSTRRENYMPFATIHIGGFDKTVLHNMNPFMLTCDYSCLSDYDYGGGLLLDDFNPYISITARFLYKEDGEVRTTTKTTYCISNEFVYLSTDNNGYDKFRSIYYIGDFFNTVVIDEFIPVNSYIGVDYIDVDFYSAFTLDGYSDYARWDNSKPNNSIPYGKLASANARTSGFGVIGELVGGYSDFTYVNTVFNGSFVSNDFNPIAWVVNIGDSFLDLIIFKTTSGIPITLGLLLGGVLTTFITIAVLKIYWGG